MRPFFNVYLISFQNHTIFSCQILLSDYLVRIREAIINDRGFLSREMTNYLITPAVKYRRFYLLKFPSAALLSIVVALATTHSSALQMKIYSA